MKKIPLRTCMGCNEKKTKKELIRIVKDKEGNICVDKTGKKEGRGAYICNDIECVKKAYKTKKLERTFKMKISEEIYERLEGIIVVK